MWIADIVNSSTKSIKLSDPRILGVQRGIDDILDFCNEYLTDGDISKLTKHYIVGYCVYDNRAVDEVHGVIKSYDVNQFVVSFTLKNFVRVCDVQYTYNNGELTLDQVKF